MSLWTQIILWVYDLKNSARTSRKHQNEFLFYSGSDLAEERQNVCAEWQAGLGKSWWECLMWTHWEGEGMGMLEKRMRERRKTSRTRISWVVFVLLVRGARQSELWVWQQCHHWSPLPQWPWIPALLAALPSPASVPAELLLRCMCNFLKAFPVVCSCVIASFHVGCTSASDYLEFLFDRSFKRCRNTTESTSPHQKPPQITPQSGCFL